jgi:hypothetical protein
LALEAEPLKPASRQKVREALNALSDVLNAVASHYLKSTTFFDAGTEHGGALSLLYVLDDGLNAERSRRKRLESDNCDPDGYKPREL